MSLFIISRIFRSDSSICSTPTKFISYNFPNKLSQIPLAIEKGTSLGLHDGVSLEHTWKPNFWNVLESSPVQTKGHSSSNFKTQLKTIFSATPASGEAPIWKAPWVPWCPGALGQGYSDFLMCASPVTSVVSDSLCPYEQWPTRLLCPWDSPGKNTGVGCQALIQGIFPCQESNLHLLGL